MVVGKERMHKALNCLHGGRCWTARSTETRPLNLKEKLEVLTNSTERSGGGGRLPENEKEKQGLQSKVGMFCHTLNAKIQNL